MNQQELSTTAGGVSRGLPAGREKIPQSTAAVSRRAARIPLLARAGRSLRARNPLSRDTESVCGHLYVDDTDPTATRYRIATPPRHGRATITAANEFRYVATRAAVRAATSGGPRSDTFTLIGHHRDGTSATLAVVVPIGCPSSGAHRPVAPSVNVVATAVIPVGDNRHEMVMSADGRTIYTFSPGNTAVVAMNTVSNQVDSTIEATGPVTAIAVAPDGSRLYAAVQTGDCVDVIDTDTGEVIDSLWIDSPIHLVLSSDGSRLLVATAGGEIEVIDTASILTLTTLEDVGAVQALLLTPDDSRLFVVADSGATSALRAVETPLTDPTTIGTIATRGIVTDTAMSADGSRIMLLDSGIRRSSSNEAGGDTVVVIDTATATTVSTVVLDGNHCALAVGADADTVHAVGTLDGCVTVIDISDTDDVRMATTRVGSLPRQAIIGDGGAIYVADNQTVTVMSRTVSGTVLGGPCDGGVEHELIRRPSRGAVTVCDDGSFVYTADTPFVVDDRFGVRIRDRYRRTEPADVDVLVIGPPIP